MELEIFPSDPLNPGFGYSFRITDRGETVVAEMRAEEVLG